MSSVLQLGQPIPGRGQVLGSADSEAMATCPVNADRSGAGLYGQPGFVCRHAAFGDMIPPANPTKQRPIEDADELAVGIDGDLCCLAEEDNGPCPVWSVLEL